MEEHLCDVSHASQLGDMDLKSSVAPQNPPFPPNLHVQCDSVESPNRPPFRPHLHTHDSRHWWQQPCAQESCETTGGIDAEDYRKPHIQGHGDLHMDDSFEAVRLDLSLKHGGHHEAQHSSPVGASRESIEYSASSLTELNTSSGGIPATHPSSAFAFKSSEGEPWENTCSSSTNRMFAFTQPHQIVGDFNTLSPTTRGHSVFQMRVDGSQASPLAGGTLPAKGGFVASHDEKVFFCKFCDRRFHSSQALGGHQNAHKRERLVARSTPRFGATPLYCAGLPGMSVPLPYASNYMHEHEEDRPQACPQLVATMCRDRCQASLLVGASYEDRLQPLQSPTLLATLCNKDTFQAPPLVSIMCNSELDYMPRNNAYNMCNRSLGIKAHSLVHKPAADDSFAPRTGHVKAVNVMPVLSQAGAAQHKWLRASIDVQPGVAKCFAPGQDHIHQRNMQVAARFEGSMPACPSFSGSACAHQHDARFLLHKDAPALLHHHHHVPLNHTASRSTSKPLYNHMPCMNAGFLHELDSNSPVLDLALRL